MWFLKKISLRRSQVREKKIIERLSQINHLASTDRLISALLVLLFTVLFTIIISFELILRAKYFEIIPRAAIAMLLSLGAAFYIHHYQKRLLKNHTRASALVGLFIVLSAVTKLSLSLSHQPSWATGTAITAAVILTIAYDQRFAIGMSIFYCALAYFAARPMSNINLFLTMTAGAFTCCLFLKEIRTRMKLLEVTALAAAVVFVTSASLDFLAENPQLGIILSSAGRHAGITLVVGVLIQGLLPLIEKIFRIATSMTLLDYSDANQPLLKRLAMEAPGTFSHSLLVGSIAEAAAEAIGRNGLLCRVGAYYHDIGKINKPAYFAENETASMSRHKELSPAMSQLVIVGHVKDGIEMAREYNLPAVLRQFIETHHGTTLIEYFYNEARKKYEENESNGSSGPSESEFRYTGPKPRTKEAAIVMLADAVEGAVRALPEVIPTRIEATIHNMAMKRLQDGQFDECELSLRELSLIEASMAKTLAAHYHGRIAYPKLTPIPRNRSAKSPEPQNGKPLNHQEDNLRNNHKVENSEETHEETQQDLQSEPDEQIPQQIEPDLPVEQYETEPDQTAPDEGEQPEQEIS